MDLFDSIFSSVSAFVYRCRNDADYTMETINGAIEMLTGYRHDEVLGNQKVSYVGLVHPPDVEKMVMDIDAAIEAKTTWDVFYRIVHKDGQLVPVRERGLAIFENGEIKFLEGLVVPAKDEAKLIDKLQATLEQTTNVNKDILSVTNDITHSLSQLTMLSINARIEAARSGDAGRGFAVVATEMKALADANEERARSIRRKLSRNGSAVQDAEETGYFASRKVS